MGAKEAKVKHTAIRESVDIAGAGPVVFEVEELGKRLKSLTDIRHDRGKRYALPVLLLLIVFAKLSGQDRPSGIAGWVKYRCGQLAQALDLAWSSMPHHNTYRRIIQWVVDPDELDEVVREFFKSLPNVGKSILVSIDGKTVRGTIDLDNPRGTHLLAAYLPEEGIVLFQVEAGRKENEISVAPKLLAGIDLRGKVVCGDAEHTQRKLSIQILEAGGDYLWFVKDNQPTLREDIRQVFEADDRTVLGGRVPNDFQTYRTVDKGHGRIETREITVSSELKSYSDWPGLEQVFKLDRQRVNCQSGKEEREIAYGLTSQSPAKASAETVLYQSRTYWGIESGLHQRRDVTFHEDATRLTRGRAGRVMATINNLVIGLLRYAGHANLADARRQYDAHLTQTLTLLAASSLT